MCQRQPIPRVTPSSSSGGQSLIGKIDPGVRALNTIIYGFLVHFGTIWMMEASSWNNYDGIPHEVPMDMATTSPSYPHQGYTFPLILLLHEYWIYLQHANVLANPFLQHLDRQYGISLLKKNRHWAIAGTLASYWCRETMSMLFALPYLHRLHSRSEKNHSCDENGSSFSTTQYLILYSILYHMIKSRGVRTDALQRCSSRFGIMRLVIDRFYLDSLGEVLYALFRFFLQGLDTFVHFSIIRDLSLVLAKADGYSSMPSSSIMVSIHTLFIIWVIHSALNQLFRCSTASVMVHYWQYITAHSSSHELAREKSVNEQRMKQQPEQTECDDSDERTMSSSCSSTSLDANETALSLGLQNDDKYIVRKLLHPDRVPNHLRGRQGTVSSYVDKVVRIQTAVGVLASLLMIGLGEVPFRLIGELLRSDWSYHLLKQSNGVQSSFLLSWLFVGLFCGVHPFILGTSRYNQRHENHRREITRRKVLINSLDMAVVIIIGCQGRHMLPQWMAWLVCALITIKSFLQSMHSSVPRFLLRSILAIEFLCKLSLLKILLSCSLDEWRSSFMTTILSSLWLIWVSSHPTPIGQDERCCADAIFLGHPAELSDWLALWMLPYSLKDRWKPPFWASTLWPLYFVVGSYGCKYRRKLFGDEASFFCCDDVKYGNARLQNWVSGHFARHFATHPRQVRENIEAAARHAERIGVKVLCLGALNKAESINGGGVGVVNALGPHRKISVIHGNHLTAAAVVETIRQCFVLRKEKFFLTGSSSKVGWAVAQSLKESGHHVLCHSTDQGRRKFFTDNGFLASSSLVEGASFSDIWIVGKYDIDVAKEIPQNSTAIVFAVPHPLEGRPDVCVIEAGTLHMDLNRLDRPRIFANKLKEHEIFACHAASAVAVHRLQTKNLTRIDEVGPVDITEMNSWLLDAKKLGFRVPRLNPVAPRCSEPPAVVIVGAGPAGLSAAAGLSRRHIPHVILETEIDENIFGSWHVLSGMGANITTQKWWCNLPGYELSDRHFPTDYVSPDDYQRYLKQYTNRFSLNIRRGARVTSIEKDSDHVWRVKYEDIKKKECMEIVTCSVIVATGKHRVVCAKSNADLVGNLVKSKIPFTHSSQMSPEKWRLAIQAAMDGALCIVGFGNSAADLVSTVLQSCAIQSNDKIASPTIHLSARTVPPVFPQHYGLFRVDTLGSIVRQMPMFLQEYLIRLLRWSIPSTRLCDASFPSHLKRWEKLDGRVPVIDKRWIASGFKSGQLRGHGPIVDVNENREVCFQDHSYVVKSSSRVHIDMVILATGFKEECIVDRDDKVNGLYKLGFGKENLLPLKSICEEAEAFVEEIGAYHQFQI